MITLISLLFITILLAVKLLNLFLQSYVSNCVCVCAYVRMCVHACTVRMFAGYVTVIPWYEYDIVVITSV